MLNDKDCENVYELVYSSHRAVAQAAGEFLNTKLFSREPDDAAKMLKTKKGKKRSENTPLIRDLVQFFIESEVSFVSQICLKSIHIILDIINPFYPEYDSSRSYPFYPEYDSGRSLHLARLPRTLTFWNPIGWLTPNDVSISGSLGNPYFSTNQCRSLGICRTNRAPPSQSEIKDGVESQRSLKGKQSQCLDHMGLTELIKSNNFQQQSYF